MLPAATCGGRRLGAPPGLAAPTVGAGWQELGSAEQPGSSLAPCCMCPLEKTSAIKALSDTKSVGSVK